MKVQLIEEFSPMFGIITASTLVTISLFYLIAGCRAYHTLKESKELQLRAEKKLKLLPLFFVLLGIIITVIPACTSAALVSSLYLKIPYKMSIDYAIAWGFGLALFFGYIHWGRMRFLHQL
mmetsp:Transcript_31856/g.39134  ORF Transcript_31856/g.39134 Transcript_31856/m.39134 type:complete len:121 (-) Transcript_31856:208-570(-)